MKHTLFFSFFLILFSCSDPVPKEELVVKEKRATPASEKKETQNAKKQEPVDAETTAYYRSFLVPKKVSFSGYTFEFGYKEYNEETFGFQNPGYLRVLNKGKIVFEDTFEGEGEVSVKSLGYHLLSGKKLLFTLNYGTPACDYNTVSRYYVFSSNQQARFLKECYSSCGGDGYACHIFDHIFPEDSLGVPNTILFPEGIRYNEHDQEDKIDTTRILFSNGTFKIRKPVKG